MSPRAARRRYCSRWPIWNTQRLPTTDQFVVNTDRIIVKRSADPDGSVYSQVSMQPGINDFIAREQMECWCESLGSFADSQTAFVVVAFALSQLRELPQPTTEEELQDHTRERGTLESDPIRLFGLRLCVTAAPAMGQVSFGLREIAVDPAPPLDATRGTAILTSCFVLKSADNLVLPPPMSNGVHANQVRGNSTMKVWCGVGEVVSTICCSDINALPTVKPAILAAPPFGPQSARRPRPSWRRSSPLSRAPAAVSSRLASSSSSAARPRQGTSLRR